MLTDKIYLENEIGQLKKRSSRLEEELRHLRSPPFIIGNVQDVLDDDRAIVRSSNGTVFLVSRNRRLPEAELRPGTRVALNQDSLSIIDVLTDAHDPLVAAAEIIDSPGVDYDDMGGLDEQIERAGRTLEVAFAFDNLEWTQEYDNRELKLRIRAPQDLEDLALRLHNKVHGSNYKKTDFALALLAKDPDGWTVPRYIAEGLQWLEETLGVAEQEGEEPEDAAE